MLSKDSRTAKILTWELLHDFMDEQLDELIQLNEELESKLNSVVAMDVARYDLSTLRDWEFTVLLYRLQTQRLNGLLTYIARRMQMSLITGDKPKASYPGSMAGSNANGDP